MRRGAFVLGLAAALLLGGAALRAQQAAPLTIANAEIAHPAGFPAIGKWMIAADGSIAHWLGQMFDGKHLHEPINVILIDAVAASADEAVTRLLAAAAAAGYPVRFGHSAGYRGFIGGDTYAQLPAGRDDAFSNRLFEESNNHGRVFGPHRFGAAFVFVGAFSRERVDLLRWPGHRYASFNQARDDFARDLAARTVFKSAGSVRLGNAVNDAQVTTGDHDGMAVVLRAAR
jgi:hypothetical protein